MYLLIVSYSVRNNIVSSQRERLFLNDKKATVEYSKTHHVLSHSDTCHHDMLSVFILILHSLISLKMLIIRYTYLRNVPNRKKMDMLIPFKRNTLSM